MSSEATLSTAPSDATPLRQERVRPLAPVLLLGLAAAASLLAVYQWMELVVVRGGGTAICAVNDTVNCATVWSSPFATRVHELLGMPVAGLGLVWGLAAFALCLRLTERTLGGAALEVPVAAVRLAAAAGGLACVTFAVASAKVGAVCLTCLLTFALVAGFAAVAFLLLPGQAVPEGKVLGRAALWSLVPVGLAYAALLPPGLATRKVGLGEGLQASRPAATAEQVEAKVGGFLQGLPWAEKQAVSDALALYRKGTAPDTSRFQTRARFGPEEAPVKIVDFTDILCGHCRVFEDLVSQLKGAAPAGSFSHEARYFPLDSECNPLVSGTDGKGVRCAGAKAQICLEGARDYAELRSRLFAEQASLTKESVLAIASSGSVTREALEACIASDATTKKLADDVAYASLYKPQGTPLVLVNGRAGLPSGAWLYAMAMVKGDVDSKVFANLPPPR